MEERRSHPERGFTVLEVMVAIAVLNVFVALIANAFMGHDQILRAQEEWYAESPVFAVVQSRDAVERAIGLPASLRRVDGKQRGYPVSRAPKGKRRGRYAVEVLESTPDLLNGHWTVVVAQTVRKDGGSEDDDDDDDDRERGGHRKEGRGEHGRRGRR